MPDRVPYCELAIDRALAQKLMGWPPVESQAADLEANVFTVEESKAAARPPSGQHIVRAARAGVCPQIPGRTAASSMATA